MAAANLRRWHRLIGLVIGLPCLLWGLSGALLAWKNWAGPRPSGLTQASLQRPFSVPIGTALQALGRRELPTQVEWRHVAGAPRYVARFAQPPLVQVVDGESGQALALPTVDEHLARQIGQAEAAPGVQVTGCVLQATGSLVYPAWNELPVFRVTLGNGDDVYVAPSTGAVLGHVDMRFRAIRVAFYGLHVWRFGDTPDGPSYLFLLVMGLVLAAAGATGLTLGLRGLWPARRR